MKTNGEDFSSGRWISPWGGVWQVRSPSRSRAVGASPSRALNGLEMSRAASSPELDERSYLLALFAVQLDVLAVEAPESAAEFLSSRLGRSVAPEELSDAAGLFRELVFSSQRFPETFRSWLRRTLMENALEDHALGMTPLLRLARGRLGLEAGGR